MLKVKTIEGINDVESFPEIKNKEKVEVLAQIDCSTRRNPYGFFRGCRDDCTDPNKDPWFGSYWY